MPALIILVIVAGGITAGSVAKNRHPAQASRPPAASSTFDATLYSDPADCLTAAALAHAPLGACHS
jgi:hypothetical protein